MKKIRKVETKIITCQYDPFWMGIGVQFDDAIGRYRCAKLLPVALVRGLSKSGCAELHRQLDEGLRVHARI